MAGLTIAARVLEELRRSGRPLDEDEFARRLRVHPRQTINQECRRLERSGHLGRYTGSEGKIVNDVRPSSAAQSPQTASAIAARGRDAGLPVAVSAPSSDSGPAWPGHPVTLADLRQVGFQPLELRVTRIDVDLPAGRGCEWTTIGEVPDAPGLYAFTVEDDHQIQVAYVGLTGTGGARGGQRYGRPRHSGVTRQRINILIVGQLREGRTAHHQLEPAPGGLESRLIAMAPGKWAQLVGFPDWRWLGGRRRSMPSGVLR